MSLKASVPEAQRFSLDIGAYLRGLGLGGYPVGLRGVYAAWLPALRRRPTQKALAAFSRAVVDEIDKHAEKAVEMGIKQAYRQIALHTTPSVKEAVFREHTKTAAITAQKKAVDAVAAKHAQQAAAASAYLAMGMPPSMIAGTDDDGQDKGGVFSASALITTASAILLALLWDTFGDGDSDYFTANESGLTYYKIAVAALDERTTETCLNVHGQVQKLDDPFLLDGEPRFDDMMMFPPFHWHCRTAVALYVPEIDPDGAAQIDALRESAEKIKQERKAGGSGYRHPASALA